MVSRKGVNMPWKFLKQATSDIRKPEHWTDNTIFSGGGGCLISQIVLIVHNLTSSRRDLLTMMA